MKQLRNVSRLLVVLALLASTFSFNSCASTKHKSFEVGEPGWTDILISEKVEQKVVLNKCVEIVTRKGYEPEMISKDTGYMRTKWKNVTSIKSSGFFGRKKETISEYRLRVVIQVSADGERVGIKCIAERLDKGRWIVGNDTEELKSISELIRGSVAGY